ncbi:MAG TPA: adenylosuccinate lyase [Polyangiaceae bacterium]|nr:adenylosuccinate lyase [Polyangiaceae bacterium]
MIPRYTPPPFADLWSAQAKYDTWLAVELAACEAMEAAEIVPQGTAGRIRAAEPKLDPQRIDEIDKTVKHDVIAFLTHVEELVGADARWLHFGMTSSDVLDTSFALQLVKAHDLLSERLETLIEAMAARAKEQRDTPMIGRSHGIHAEPTTVGMALASHLAELKRCRRRLALVREDIAVGKIAGAVGTYAHLSTAIEKDALGRLGLTPETVSTQVVSRDRHAAFFCAMALVASAIERFATNVRHWQRTEVGEAEEAFTKGQKGSSAMPHKRNPILSENLCGLARVVRGAVTPAIENVALWHERDISHSSVERMIAPDATTTLGFMLQRCTRLVQGLVIYPERLEQNLALTGGRCFSEGVLLGLVRAGKPRQEAYVVVQRAAMAAFEGKGTFQELLSQDAEVIEALGDEGLARCFALDHALRHTGEVVDRALEAP